ncbi:hypothetical protein GC175_32535 [bacterium]|nr:hypothetical protein [bacterium]
MSLLSLSFFGSFRAVAGENTPVQFSTRSARGLLIYLTMHPGVPFEREHLSTLLWPESSRDQAQTSLRQTLYRLRRSLTQAGAADDHLIADATSICFNAESNYRLDIHEFTNLLDQCDAHPHPQPTKCQECAQRITRAISLFTSDFLTGFALADAPAFEEWQAVIQERLHNRAVTALETLARYQQTQRDYNAAIATLQQILALEPWREESHVALMRCYLLDGKRHLALQQYDTLTRTLAAELNAVPGAEAQALYRQLRNSASDAQPASRPLANPYCGLNPFEESQAAYFFGRESLVNRLVDELDRRPAVLLVGVSGCGKSSVLQAGVLPALHAQDGGRRAVLMRPGEDPFAALAEALHPLVPTQSETGLSGALRSGQTTLPHFLRHSLFSRQGSAGSLVILIDQFEELFARVQDEALLLRFLDLILDTTNAKFGNNRVSFLMALRADFLGKALVHGKFAGLVQEQVLAVGALSPAEMARTVEMPAYMQNVFFEPGLVTRLIQDVGDDPGRLPLLQFCLSRLWQEQKDGWITHAAYTEIEELSGALNHYADGILARLEPEQQRTARRVFLRLVHVQEDVEPSRRLGLHTEFSDDEWKVVQVLINARLLTTDQTSSGIEGVELVHETLIRNWARLNEWLQADRAFFFWREGLRGGVRLWEKSGRDSSALLRGGLLAEAEVRIGDRWEELSQAESDFIAASLALRRQEEEAIARQQAQERERAETLAVALQSRTEALAAAQRATRQAESNALLAASQLALFQRDTDKALHLALAALDDDDPRPEAELMLADAAYAPGTIRTLHGNSGPIYGVALFPDGRRAVAATATGRILIWDLQSGDQLMHLTGHEGAVFAVHITSDGKMLLSCAEDASIILWDAESGAQLCRMQAHSGPVRALCLHPDGQRALSAGDDKQIILWDLASGRPLAHWQGHAQPIRSLAISPDGKRALSGDAQGTVIHWDLDAGKLLHSFDDCTKAPGDTSRFDNHYDAVWGVAFTLDGLRGISVSQDQRSILWDLVEGKLLRRFGYPRTGLLSLALHPTRESAILGRLDSGVAVLDLKSGDHENFLGHTGRVHSIVVDHKGNRALSGAADGTARLWELHHGAEIRSLSVRRIGSTPGSLDISQDESIAAVGTWLGNIALIDLESGEIMRSLHGHSEVTYAGIRFLPDRQHLISASGDFLAPIDDFSVRLWDIHTGKEIHRFLGHTDKIWDMALSPDFRFAITGSHDGTLRRWDLRTGECQIIISVYPQCIISCVYSPSGKEILIGLGKGASSIPDYSLRLLDSSGRELHRFYGHTESVQDVSFSPDGSLAISGSLDQRMMLWNVKTANRVASLTGSLSACIRIAFSPNGTLICAGTMKGEILLWHTERQKLIRRLTGHHGAIMQVIFSTDGNRVYSIDDESTIRSWRVDPDLAELKEWIRHNRLVGDLVME